MHANEKNMNCQNILFFLDYASIFWLRTITIRMNAYKI